MIPFALICAYLFVLLWVGRLGYVGHAKNTSLDFFLASRTCGAFLLLMSIFGTTMTSFALVGSTGAAMNRGIGVYGLMASWSGLIHSACFFLIGMKLWYHGKRFGYSTQMQFFRDRFQSPALTMMLFPILVALVVPYVIINILGSGNTIQTVTDGAFLNFFPATHGGVPAWLGSLVVCVVVLIYVFGGGMRSLAFANGVHATILVILGGATLLLVMGALGGAEAATQRVAEIKPELLARQGKIPHLEFLTYMFVPLSVGMFPHLFQHWMTAKSAKTFRPVLLLHPIFIMLVWVPCMFLGIWAAVAVMKNGGDVTAVIPPGTKPDMVLGMLVKKLTNPWVAGLLGVGIVSATMSLDSQFLALSSMFTHDIIVRFGGEERFSDRQRIFMGRTLVVLIVAIAYGLSLIAPATVFSLGVWCFSGFSALFPLIFASLYWKRVTTAGAMASIVTAAGIWATLFWRSGWGANKDYLFPEIPNYGMLPAATMVIGAAVALVLVSLVTKPPADDVVAKFFPEENDLAQPAEQPVGAR